MMEKELIPNDTPEIAKLKACKSLFQLNYVYSEIKTSKAYKFHSEEYKKEMQQLYYKLAKSL